MYRPASRIYLKTYTVMLMLCLSSQSLPVLAGNQKDSGRIIPVVADKQSLTAHDYLRSGTSLINPAGMPATAEALPRCGGEGEFPCSATTEFFWDNGNLFCDRGLQATGFKAIEGPVYFDSNEWLNLNRVNLNKLRTLMTVDFPRLQDRLQGLDENDFLGRQCLGKMVNGKCYTVPPVCGALGCTPGIPGEIVPFPDFSKSGWDIPQDIINFMKEVFEALDAANLPVAIKSIPGARPRINFSLARGDFDIKDLDITRFKDEFNKLKNFLNQNLFFNLTKSLMDDFFRPRGSCVNRTRQQPAARIFKQTWAYWALLNQYELAKDEPLNWAQRIDAHNAYNNAADGYPLPNQQYSITDQLNMGVRSLSLDIHWFNNQLRLCHGKADHSGCGMTDRYYANGIKEIGNWLRANPTEVITINLEDRAEEDHDHFVNAPISEYLVRKPGAVVSGSMVFTPALGRLRGFNMPDAEARVPTMQEVRDAGKQVIIFSSDTHGGSLIWKRAENPFATSRAKAFFFTNENYNLATGQQPPTYNGGQYRCVAFTPNAGFDFTRFAPDNRAGFFTTVYEARSLFDPFDSSGLLDEAEVAQLAKCQVTEISLDFVNSKDKTSRDVCLSDPSPATCNTPDTRIQSAIWSWRVNDRGGSTGDAAMMNGTDGRWSSRDPNELHNFACSKPREGNPDTWPDRQGVEWKITAGAGRWLEGDRQCRQEFGEEYTFSVPRIGFQNEMLKRANAAFLNLWLNYNDIVTEGKWVVNNRPRIDPGPDQTVNEGQNVLFKGTADADGDNVIFQWDFGDGSNHGAGPTPQHVYADDGTYTVTLTVLDQYGGIVSKSMTVTVNNIGPTLILASGNQSATLGSVLSLQGVGFTDPGFDCDTCASASTEGFTSTIDWDDGQTDVGVASFTSGAAGKLTAGTITGSHAYTSAGEYTVRVCITDDEQGSDCQTLKITVLDTGIPNVDGIDTASSVNGVATASWGNLAGPGSPNSVTAVALGDGTLTVAGLTQNPASSKGFTSSNAFSYVRLEQGHRFRLVTITNCRLKGGNLAYWWNGNEWKVVSDQQYDRQRGCVTMKLNSSTIPSINDLTNGGYFAIKNSADQLLDLLSLVEGFNLKKPAARKFDHGLNKALEAYRREDVQGLCRELDWFIKKVNQESTKKFSSAESGDLLIAANRIKGFLGCR